MNAPFSQLDADGRLRHLITLNGLGRGLLEELLERASGYVAAPGQPATAKGSLRGYTVANLFTEPSTRTRASFELAALRLGAHVVNLDIALSSRAKGESALDTIWTLQELRVDLFVIRDAEPGLHELVARQVAPHVSVISGGEAHVSHPTQGLLDALTIRQLKGGFDGLVVVIAGDIRRSRVARSAHRILATLGAQEIRLVAPQDMMPDESEFEGARRIDSLDEGVAQADVIMMLRIQHERARSAFGVDLAAYHRDYGLTPARLERARPGVVVMHPGPMNRGIEIDSEVADGPQSAIRRQVANGLAVRMAVLDYLIEARLMRLP